MSCNTVTSFSVFIPRVFPNITEERIANVFHYMDIGSVEKVDLVPRTNKNGEPIQLAFVHFSELYQTTAGKHFYEDIMENKTSKVVYDDPWYWNVVAYEKKQRVERVNKEPQQAQQAQQAQQGIPPNSMFMGYGYMVMTPHGVPMWCPIQPLVPCTPSPPPYKMVPPQLAYGKMNPPKHPRKRVNVPKIAQEIQDADDEDKQDADDEDKVV